MAWTIERIHITATKSSHDHNTITFISHHMSPSQLQLTYRQRCYKYSSVVFDILALKYWYSLFLIVQFNLYMFVRKVFKNVLLHPQNRAWTGYPPWTAEFTPVLEMCLYCSNCSFLWSILSTIPLFVCFLFVCFWPLYCLYFCELGFLLILWYLKAFLESELCLRCLCFWGFVSQWIINREMMT